jgi:hypothetical protein
MAVCRTDLSYRNKFVMSVFKNPQLVGICTCSVTYFVGTLKGTNLTLVFNIKTMMMDLEMIN